MAGEIDFEFSPSREPHRDRTQAILRAHPDLRGLVGKNPFSFLIIAGIVAGQFALAWGLSGRPGGRCCSRPTWAARLPTMRCS